MKASKIYLGTGTLVAALTFGQFGGIAGAQTPPTATPQPVRVEGRVYSVGANSLNITTRRGQATVNVGPNTWILVQQSQGPCAEGTLKDIQTNKPVTVAGMTSNQQATINARTITQGRCGAAAAKATGKQRAAAVAAHFAMGTIKSINGSVITVTTERGPEANVNTTADTVVLNGGFKSVSTLKVGDKVEIMGQPVKNTDKTTQVARAINAWALRVVTPGSSISTGHVQSVSGNTITLNTPKNRASITVTLDSSTSYRSLAKSDGKAALTNATQSDIKSGSNIIVEGLSSADGKTVTAKAVIILPAGKTPDKAAKPAKPAKP